MDNTKVLAVVGGQQITQTDVEMLIASMGQAGQNYMSPQGRAAVLEELINQKLLLLMVFHCPMVYQDKTVMSN